MKKILIVYATYGTGHRAIAKYVEEYFKNQKEEYEIKNIDLLSYSIPLMNKVSTSISNKLILSGNPFLWGIIYKYFDHKVTSFGSYRLISKIFDTEKLKKEIIGFNPDLVISTHFFASSAISRYKRKGYLNSKLITVITDYESHEFWLKSKISEDALIVSSKEEKKEMQKKGIPGEKIKIYGIPISDRFKEECNNKAILKQYGFSGEKPLFLFFGGGGCGSKTSLPYLKMLLKLNLNIDLIYVAGADKKLKIKAQKMVQKYNNDRTRVFGFVNNVPELMNISDAVITKPGGITVTECLSLNKPMILINKTAGHERGNFKYLTKNGFALNGSTKRKFKRNIIGITKNEKILNKIKVKISKNAQGKEAMEKLYRLSCELLNCKK